MRKGRSLLDYVIFILLIAIILILLYSLFFKNIFKSRYAKMEDEMVSSAKEYIQRNNISISKEIYLDVSKLGVSLDNDCNLTSGVIFNGTTYEPFLSCLEYKSNVIPQNNEIKDYIELNGDEVIVLAKGMTYYDPGYISKDIVNKSGFIGTEEGVYSLYYKTTNSNQIAIRKVIIIDNYELKNSFPNIKLNGDEITYVIIGNTYNEKGVEATDVIDGNINNKVIVKNDINTSVLGEYNVSYSVTNSRGYTNTVNRIVGVVGKNSDLVIKSNIYPETLTNDKVTIKLVVNEEYQKILYPDGTDGISLEYDVHENGIYKFIVFDKYGRDIEHEVEIKNIDNTIPEGTCTATTYYDQTKVEVNIRTTNEISNYEYNLDGDITNSKANTLVSKIVKPTSVKVRVKDIINNQNEIICSVEKPKERQIVTNEKGKNCLEGTVCYVQFEWTDNRNHKYCSMPNNPKTCGGIGSNGCSITSATNAIAAMGVKSSAGTLHTPWTVYDELYPINKSTGICGGGCSGWSRIRDAVVNAGLTAPEQVSRFNQANLPMVIENLQKGYPVIIYAEGHPYSSSKAHYMTLLAIRDDGYVFLSDSANESGTGTHVYNGHPHPVDTWIPTSDLLSGNVTQFLLVGPPGLYQGKLR